MNLANVQAGYLDNVARINSKMAPWAVVGGGLTTASNLMLQYNMGKQQIGK